MNIEMTVDIDVEDALDKLSYCDRREVITKYIEYISDEDLLMEVKERELIEIKDEED